jgi:lipopolysaccharide/colanic/teichoic acid biosynthesis glycosyltransferase
MAAYRNAALRSETVEQTPHDREHLKAGAADPREWRAHPPHLPEQAQTVGSFWAWYPAWKLIAEFIIAIVLLVVAAPIIFVAGLLIVLTSRGPIFYCQIRLGRNGKPFRVIKLRTMRHNCEKVSGICWALPGDPRVTAVGRILRRTHLDELPQLWNILKGEMSLVGPRPERPEFMPELERAIPHYRDRLLVRPGVTGLAQVQLPADTDLAGVRRKLAYDLYYVRHVGVWLDVRLVVCTVAHVVGVPFRVLRRLFVIPSPERIENCYMTWQANGTCVSHLQSA